MHKEAMAEGSMECFFHLIEAFHTQDEPAFCGLGTLVNVLNALEVDPGTLWKGVWRWYSEKMLDCCVDLDQVAKRGLTFDEWECLAKCQGLTIDARRAADGSVEHFRRSVVDACGSTSKVVCLSYSRKPLGQTGDGHFSPVGGYHAAKDLVLVLDCARFKYPPHWVPLELLWQAMLPKDESTGHSRGYMLVSRGGDGPDSTCFVRLTVGVGRVAAIRSYFGGGCSLAEAAKSPGEELWRAMRNLSPLCASIVAMVSCEHTNCAAADKERMEELLDSLRRTPLHKAFGPLLSDEAPLPLMSEAAVVLLLLLPEVISEEGLAAALPLSLPLLRDTERLLEAEPGGALAAEVTKTRRRFRMIAETPDPDAAPGDPPAKRACCR